MMSVSLSIAEIKSSWETGGSDSRVRRGGSWSDNQIYCRSAARDLNSPGVLGRFRGFRVVGAFSVPSS